MDKKLNEINKNLIPTKLMEGLMEHLTEVNEKRCTPEVGSVHGNHR